MRTPVDWAALLGTSNAAETTMDKAASALVSAAAVLTAAITGAQHGPQRPTTAAWYGLLRKPAHTPPGALIGGAWGVLEVLLGVTGYRLLRAPPGRVPNAATGAWSLTLIGLAFYPWLFFGRKRLAASTPASGAMLASATGVALAARQIDPPAARMTVPLLLWLGFATMPGEELRRRNHHISRDG